MDCGITHFVDDDELYVQQYNCAVIVKVRPVDVDDKKCWQVLVGADPGGEGVALFDTYGEAWEFCSDLAEFINDEMERRYHRKFEGG